MSWKLPDTVRFWLTEAGAGALVPRVFPAPDFEAMLIKIDHHGFWIESKSGKAAWASTPPVRLLRRDFVASLQLNFRPDDNKPDEA